MRFLELRNLRPHAIVSIAASNVLFRHCSTTIFASFQL